MAGKRFWRADELTTELVESILAEIPSDEESAASDIQSEEDDALENCISSVTTHPGTPNPTCDNCNEQQEEADDDLGQNNKHIGKTNTSVSTNWTISHTFWSQYFRSH